MNASRCLGAFAALAIDAAVGLRRCRPDSRAKVRRRWRRTRLSEFDTLYAENCAGCHGAEGRGGAAIALADPVYLRIADEAAMRAVIANGVRGTSMPAFAQSAGGMLTDKQIDVITREIRSRWSRPGILDGANPPSYAATVHRRRAARRGRLRNVLRILPRSPAVEADRRAARSRTIRFWRWSAIRGCARSSSPAVPNWARPTGAETSRASRCPTRKSPTSSAWLASRRVAKSRAALFRFE